MNGFRSHLRLQKPPLLSPLDASHLPPLQADAPRRSNESTTLPSTRSTTSLSFPLLSPSHPGRCAPRRSVRPCVSTLTNVSWSAPTCKRPERQEEPELCFSLSTRISPPRLVSSRHQWMPLVPPRPRVSSLLNESSRFQPQSLRRSLRRALLQQSKRDHRSQRQGRHPRSSPRPRHRLRHDLRPQSLQLRLDCPRCPKPLSPQLSRDPPQLNRQRTSRSANPRKLSEWRATNCARSPALPPQHQHLPRPGHRSLVPHQSPHHRSPFDCSILQPANNLTFSRMEARRGPFSISWKPSA